MSGANTVSIAARLLAEVSAPASMGVALAIDGEIDADALVRDADAAMYAVKRAGGGGAQVAGDGGPSISPG